MNSGLQGQASHRDFQDHLVTPADAGRSTSAQSQSVFREEFTPEIGRNGSAVAGYSSGPDQSFAFSNTKVNNSVNAVGPSKVGTLRKQHSLNKGTTVMKRSSKRSLRGAASVKGMAGIPDEEFNNVFRVPIPTNANPTEVLANRFQAWRKLLKDLITFFREVQLSYEARSKGFMRTSNIINSVSAPTVLRAEGGLEDALATLRGYNKHALAESNKAREIEEDVITQLNGLRNDLTQKIKEIKSLAGDFRNNVDREKDITRRQVDMFREAITMADKNPIAATGKNDPFIMRLAVERQVAKQIEEENYLHRAYLNLENSGRELESIVVGEIQKAYNAFATILKREADAARDAAEELRSGPVNIPKDMEWMTFVEHDNHFVDPQIPIRKLKYILYPGMDNPSAAEIRGGMLERKSKYLKSYTPGWYVLSPTHLHEFKSADHIHTQAPVMSLYLLDQQLGSHSKGGDSSQKFSLKGRQTGSMHRGHAWVFRAETHEAMMAWYDDIKSLTEKTGEEKLAFVRKHARSVSIGSKALSMSSGFDDDDADAIPYASQPTATLTPQPERPSPGGRFPSDIDINRDGQAPMSPASDVSSVVGRASVVVGNTLPSEPMFADRHEIKSSVYLTPERARASPTPDRQGNPSVTDRQRATPTPDRLRTTPSSAMRTTASSSRSRQVSRDEGVPQELSSSVGTPSKTTHNLVSNGPNGYIYDNQVRLVPSAGTVTSGFAGVDVSHNHQWDTTPGSRDLVTLPVNGTGHQPLPAVVEGEHTGDAPRVVAQESGHHPQRPIVQDPREGSTEKVTYELDGFSEERSPSRRIETAASSIYVASEGSCPVQNDHIVLNGNGPRVVTEPHHTQSTNVVEGPAPTFNRATYDPLVETGLGISSKSGGLNGSHYGNVAERTKDAVKAAGIGNVSQSEKTLDSPYATTNGGYGIPFPGGQFSRSGTTGTVNTISNLHIPGEFPRPA